MFNVTFFSETGFPGAVGLTYKDGDRDAVLLLERDGKYVPPEDGWGIRGRVYIPQEIDVTESSSGD